MTGKQTKSQVEADLERAQERLAFYRQFDEIIKQNIASSSALLEAASIQFDSGIAGERQKMRTVLSEILDDVTALQARSEQLARRVSDALDDLEHSIPTSIDTQTAQTTTPLTVSAPADIAAVIESASIDVERAPVEPVPPAATVTPPSPSVVAASPLPVEAPIVEIPPTEPITTTLLVHGVPRASAALNLKGYIEQLDFVTGVEPREFAAGLLRLQITGTRALDANDLADWSMSDRITVKNASSDLLELDLSPA